MSHARSAREIRTPGGKRDYNKRLFAGVASRYDFDTRLLSLGRDQTWKDILVDMLPDQPAPCCLDLACGTGDLTRRLREKFPHGTIVGLDLTEAMIALAKQTVSGDIQFAIQDMGRMGIRDRSMDIVTGGYALRNAPDLSVSLKEIRRVLKPGGHAVFLDFSSPASPWLRRLECGLLKCWGGFCGYLSHGRPAHAYIGDSLQLFPDHRALRQMMEDAGFVHMRTHYYNLGMIAIMHCRKAGGADEP